MNPKNDPSAVLSRDGGGHPFKRLCKFVPCWFWPLSAHTTVLFLVAAVVVRLTVRDKYDLLAPLFYAARWPVIAAAAAWAAGFHRRRKFIGSGFAICALIAAAMWVRWDWGHFEPQDAPGKIRVAYWNVAHPDFLADMSCSYAGNLPVDLLVLGETGAEKDHLPEIWAQPFPGRTLLPVRRGLLVVAPGPAKLVDTGSLNNAGEYGIVKTEIAGAPWTLIVVDFDANVTHSRKPAFDALLALTAKHAGERILILGDFNTPGDSTGFDRLRAAGLHDAFDTAGRGLRDTWPVPVPVLTLDHILVSGPARILSCEHRWSWLSDHRPVVAEIVAE